VGIQLSYPHVDEKLTHDPSFGLKTPSQMIRHKTRQKITVSLHGKHFS
jgi:hypothetical protein